MYLTFYLFTKIKGDSLSSLTVSIDGEAVYRVDSDNFLKFPEFFTNVEIDVRKYAGTKKTIKFYFEEFFTEGDGNAGISMAVIDYATFIKRLNCKFLYLNSYILFYFILFYFIFKIHLILLLFYFLLT